MASILRSIVAGPRSKHAEANLDLCYVTDKIIATSGPSSTYPQRAYRNPTDQLVAFLDSKHGSNWQIWEFRAEGTGYPDSEVHGRVKHYPWPDHHPPPFQLIPNIMGSMRQWLHDPNLNEKDKQQRVIVVHCKAGKGRSGTIASSYLISQDGWKMDDALKRFTERRMRPGFGAGVSIPSQVRWVKYVDTWTKTGKRYVERKAEVLELHVWGLRDGCKVSVQGFEEQGKKIITKHTFDQEERHVVDGGMITSSIVGELSGYSSPDRTKMEADKNGRMQYSGADLARARQNRPTQADSGGKAVIFLPKDRILLSSSDICIDFERRNRASYSFTMVTSVAHVWFNVFFEGLASEGEGGAAEDIKPSDVPTSGVFSIDWDAMDGIKGSSKKGIRAFDKIAVVWKALDEEDGETPTVVKVPAINEPVPDAAPANWKGDKPGDDDGNHDLGLRKASDIEKMDQGESAHTDDPESDIEKVQTHLTAE